MISLLTSVLSRYNEILKQDNYLASEITITDEPWKALNESVQ